MLSRRSLLPGKSGVGLAQGGGFSPRGKQQIGKRCVFAFEGFQIVILHRDRALVNEFADFGRVFQTDFFLEQSLPASAQVLGCG